MRAVALAAGLILVFASSAAADPARPGNYRSVVTAVEPTSDAVSVEIVGGDGFLSLVVAPGHDVVVAGYAAEPWLWVHPDGLVEQSTRSPATYLNATRYARVTVPLTADAKAAPEWKEVGSGGRYAWHDHRVHWMSSIDPTGQRPGDVIYPDWQVPLVVDGVATVVHGSLTWLPPISPYPWWTLALIVGIAALLASRGRSVSTASGCMAAAAALAVPVGYRAWTSVPPAAGPNPVDVALPVAALLAAVIALIRPLWRVSAALAASSALGWWAVTRLSVLAHPMLPTTMSFAVDRLATAVALGTSVGAAVAAIRSGELVPRAPGSFRRRQTTS